MNDREQIEAAMAGVDSNSGTQYADMLDAALSVRGDDGHPLLLGLLAEKIGTADFQDQLVSLDQDWAPRTYGLLLPHPVWVPRREQEDARWERSRPALPTAPR